MPIVPSYGQPKVSQAPTPNVQVQPAAQAANFGLDQETQQARSQSQGLLADSTAIIAEEKKKADHFSVLEAITQAQKLSTDLVFDPNTGLITRKRKDSLKGSEDTLKQFDESSQEIYNGLKNRTQQEAFQNHLQAIRFNLQHSAAVHVSKEMQADREEVAESGAITFKNQGEANYSTWNLSEPLNQVSLAKKSLEGLWIDYARVERKSSQWLQAKLQGEMSEFNTRVVNRMLKNGDYLGAKDYFKANQNGFGDHAGDVEKAVHFGSIELASQRIVDELFSLQPRSGIDPETGKPYKNIPGVQTQAELNKRIDEYPGLKDNAELRKAVEARGQDVLHKTKLALNESKEALHQGVSTAIRNNPGVLPQDIFGAGAWSQMPEDERAYADRLYNPPANGTDYEAWLGYSATISQNPDKIRQMKIGEFDKEVLSHLSPKHRESALNDWQKLQKGEDFISLYKGPERVLRAAQSVGLGGITKGDTLESINKKDGDKAKAQALVEISDSLEAANAQFFENNKRNPKPDEENQILFDVMKKYQEVFLASGPFSPEPGTPRPGKFKRLNELTSEERRNYNVALEKVDPEIIGSMKAKLAANNRPQTPVAISSLYRAYLEDDLDYANYILNGDFFGTSFRGR